MKWLASVVLLLGSFLLACDSHEVKQLPVEIPVGVTVPEGMVYIPEGGFIMGHVEDPKTVGGQTVMTDAYFIDTYEVTRGQYQAFAPRDSFDPKRARLPVAWVTYQQAENYCQSQGKRLPTEMEWEKAARGVDGRKWSWERYFEHPNNGFSGLQVEPVDKRTEWISPYGVFGMGYNVWEWTEDWYAYEGQPPEEKEKFKVIRGGLTQSHLTIKFSPTYFRNWIEPTASFNFLGFRCARDA
ncbi:MAG: SUMF1/EgtB/PvdO family nonheme iron enzyme [Nitrospinae bacterium]|nr:SUMF1/EgtB/PvdO family nonheme iron enzyme [Nitrospinota bacterium]MDA1110259.1 SUMF1/EgtB/PvdO family nonheme iron enzyme [Nitrospinota bacterium]